MATEEDVCPQRKNRGAKTKSPACSHEDVLKMEQVKTLAKACVTKLFNIFWITNQQDRVRNFASTSKPMTHEAYMWYLGIFPVIAAYIAVTERLDAQFRGQFLLGLTGPNTDRKSQLLSLWSHATRRQRPQTREGVQFVRQESL